MPHGERIISHPKHVYVCLSLDVVEAARVRLDWSQPNQPLYGCPLCRVPFLESATLTSCEIARTLDIRMDSIQQLTIEVLKRSLLGYMTQINVCILGFHIEQLLSIRERRGEHPHRIPSAEYLQRQGSSYCYMHTENHLGPSYVLKRGSLERSDEKLMFRLVCPSLLTL